MDSYASHPALIPLSAKKEPRKLLRVSEVKCPVCGTGDMLRETRGMLVCTRCCWASEIPKA